MKLEKYEPLKSGDSFIRYSKHGYIFGIVDIIYHVLTSRRECVMKEWYVKSTNGVIYEYNECYKIEKKNDTKKFDDFINRNVKNITKIKK